MRNDKTDKDIFGDDPKARIQTGGRPAVDREKALLLFKAGKYTTGQIASALGCTPKTVRNIRDELIESGDLETDEMKGKKIGDVTGLDFDEECLRARGYSFYDWLVNRFSKESYARYRYNFARRTWEKIWNKPSLVRVMDQNDPIGDQICMQFLKVFGSDDFRIRNRKKNIRYLFRFLGRTDLNDMHLTMTTSKDPVQKRIIPKISMSNFPNLLQECINELGRVNPDWVCFVKSKIVFMGRTGSAKDKRGIYGLIKDGQEKSWITMEKDEDGEIEYRGQLLDKGRITWGISYLPPLVKECLYLRYKQAKTGEPIFNEKDKVKLLKEWGAITKRVIGTKFTLHDLRKVSATWYFALGVPIEILASINVGWKDLNTIKEHYLILRDLLKKSDRQAYSANIPVWFKEEIEEFIED